jgi:hypothetical protein
MRKRLRLSENTTVLQSLKRCPSRGCVVTPSDGEGMRFPKWLISMCVPRFVFKRSCVDLHSSIPITLPHGDISLYWYSAPPAGARKTQGRVMKRDDVSLRTIITYPEAHPSQPHAKNLPNHLLSSQSDSLPVLNAGPKPPSSFRQQPPSPTSSQPTPVPLRTHSHPPSPSAP